MEYRDDIDGLRALAVIAVILSHVQLLPGGYIGVDVFFVISGFLIAPSIIEKMKANSFSLIEFYTRRAKRLLPQVYAVIAVSFIAAYLLFIPTDFLAFAKSARETVFYISNFHFLSLTGYFSADSITQPLLHTWSLAVEEQFYFIAPIIIYLLLKLKNPLLFGVLIGFASLVASVVTTPHWPSANFFMLPFRMWEFIIGAAIAYLPKATQSTDKAAAIAGLGLIVYSAATLTEQSLFPGINAIPVTVGTALIIWSGNKTLLGKALSVKPMRLTGRASYSLYIWHWPIIVFYSYYSFNNFGLSAQISMIAATFIVGFFFWRILEEPLRKSPFSAKATGSATAVASLMVLSLALFVKHEGGMPSRLNQEARQMADTMNDKNYFYDSCVKPVRPSHFEEDIQALCKLGALEGKPSFAMWGDSFAASIAYGLSEEAKSLGLTGILLSIHSCPPIVDTEGWWDQTREACLINNEQAVKTFKTLGVKTVFMHASWSAFYNQDYIGSLTNKWANTSVIDQQSVVNTAVSGTVAALIKEGITPVFVSGIPTTDKNIVQKLTRTLEYGGSSEYKVPRGNLDKALIRSDIAFNETPEITILRPMQLLCDEYNCDVSKNENAITSDGAHLTKSGSILLGGVFHDELAKINRSLENHR